MPTAVVAPEKTMIDRPRPYEGRGAPRAHIRTLPYEPASSPAPRKPSIGHTESPALSVACHGSVVPKTRSEAATAPAVRDTMSPANRESKNLLRMATRMIGVEAVPRIHFADEDAVVPLLSR
jgi:hypothetical protein